MALYGTIPTGKDIPVLKDTIILILATHLLLAPHRLYQRPNALAAENTVLCEETEGLVPAALSATSTSCWPPEG